MKLLRILLSAGLLAAVAFSSIQARSLLEKPVYYLNANTNKTGKSLFWLVYLGTPECTVSRKYPGEEQRQFTVSIGLRLSSSGYVEGNGYCEKGPITCSPTMFIRSNGAERELPFDSIACIYDFGSKVRTVSGTVGDLEIDIEGQKVGADRLMMTDYTLVTDGGEKELQKAGSDISVSAMAFSMEGIAWATQAMADETKSDTARPDSAKPEERR